MYFRKRLTTIALVALVLVSLIGCDGQPRSEETGDTVTTSPAESTTVLSADTTANAVTPTAVPTVTPNPDWINQTAQSDVPSLSGYNLLWNDEFNGDTLDDGIWNREVRLPGWTNGELQAYTDSDQNVFVKDGCLNLRALKGTGADGKDTYTSGKVTSRKKEDFLYGKVVVRAKIPAGQGLWPAIWMMPTTENKYGPWPRCGEIDIMEILGNEPDTVYSTIHYGNPHAQQQGKKTLQDGTTFADSFHEYSVEWEPGEMRFYVDDTCIATMNDWFTSIEGGKPKPYPAPFNQLFYLQLNLAVGGTWPGNPDETTDFTNAQFQIDYVRVYQKPSYDTNVQKPEKIFRAPTADGNLIYNGDFTEPDDLGDSSNWSFLTSSGGQGTAQIADGVVTIVTENPGTENYAIQLVQDTLPLRAGKTYRVTFDAKSKQTRTADLCVSAPSRGWIRYLPNTDVSLTTSWTTYTYDFTMPDQDDNDGRLEFNLGENSTATVSIRNVSIREVAP